MWTAGLREGETSDGVMPLSSGLASPSEHMELDTRPGGGECLCVASRPQTDIEKKKKKKKMRIIIKN